MSNIFMSIVYPAFGVIVGHYWGKDFTALHLLICMYQKELKYQKLVQHKLTLQQLTYIAKKHNVCDINTLI